MISITAAADESESGAEALTTIHLSPAIAKCFPTLVEMKEHTRGGAEQESLTVQVPTAKNEDVLVFLGAVAEWHTENDASFARVISKQASIEAWHAQRDISVVQFDRHFCDSALAQHGNFYGQLLRTADFLGAEWLLLLLARHLATAVEKCASESPERLRNLCDAV